MSGLLEFPLLFECSWEVANKSGGIYTVLRSKVPVTVDEFGDRYCLLGPFVQNMATIEFEEIEPRDLMAAAVGKLRSAGIAVHYGRWLVAGTPNVLLFELGTGYHNLASWRREMRDAAGVHTPEHDRETNDAIVFGFLVAWFIREFKAVASDRQILLHCHEWQAAVPLTLCKIWNVPVATIFTTHATILGRYLCAGQADFYHVLQHINADEEAGRRGIHQRFAIERRAAHDAYVFTTVSDITAEEAECLLGRRADVVVPNGLQVERFTVLHEFQNLHAQYKEKIHNFIRGHFLGHMDFDLDHTLYVFTSGRYEYQNKGMDMFVESLYALNQRLKRENSTTTVIAFIITAAATNGYNVETLKRQAQLRSLEETCDSIQKTIGKRLFTEALKGNLPKPTMLMAEEDTVMLKRRLQLLRATTSLPPVVTHNMLDDAGDPILNHLRRRQLFNAPEDRVKVIYHPEFLSTAGLLPLEYEQFVRGCHLGVFASYYEPWGYTPAECVVHGVPTITSNLSGFANFMEKHVPDCAKRGVYVIDRRFKAPGESIDQMADIMVNFAHMTRRDRVELRNQVERLSQMLDWRNLGRCYAEARSLALSRLAGR